MSSLEACVGSGRFRERFESAAYRAADLAGPSPRVLGGTFGIAVIEFIRNDASIPDGRRFRDRVRLPNLFGGWTWTHRQPLGRSFRLWQHRRFDSSMCGIEPWLLRVKTGFRGLVRVKCDPSRPAVNVLLARQKREGSVEVVSFREGTTPYEARNVVATPRRSRSSPASGCLSLGWPRRAVVRTLACGPQTPQPQQ